jgi:hypothetical protein
MEAAMIRIKLLASLARLEVATSYEDLPELKYHNLHPANKKAMAKSFATFTPEHHESMRLYQGEMKDYRKFDKALQGKADPTTQKHLKNVLHVTSHAMPAPQSMYRGDVGKPLPVGHRFSRKGFTGASFDPSSTAYFYSKGRRLLHIHTPPGTKGHLLLEKKGRKPKMSDQEMTLHPNTHYEVIGHTKHKQPWDYPSADEKPMHVTHIALVGQGLKNGRPDLALTKSGAGKQWLDHIKKHYAEE